MSGEEADSAGTEPGPTIATDAAIADARLALDHIELVNVVPTQISAQATDNPRPGSDVRYQVSAEISVASGFFANRFRYEIELLDDEDETTAVLDFVLQVEYDVEEDFELGRETAEFLAQTTGLFAAYPYARELAQTLTTRLQQDPLVLGLMPRGAVGPGRVSGGRRQPSGAPEDEDQE